MATYDYEKVVTDYGTGKLTPEMVIGHSLQHIGRLYEAQAAANAMRTEWQHKVDALEQRVHGLQVAVDRLTAFMAKIRLKPKPNTSGKTQND